MSNISVALTNLGKYNEGVLDFHWLELPASDEEIAAAFDAIQVSHDDVHYYSNGEGQATGDGTYGEYEEFFITDYECDFMDISEYANLDDLNETAQKLDDLDDNQAAIVKAIMDDLGYDLEEAIDAADDAMIFWNCTDMEDVARQYLDETGAFHGVDSWLENYFDFEAYGRDMECDGSWFTLEDGSLGVIW